MSRKRSAVADYSVYLVVRCLAALVQILPRTWALVIANGLGWLAYHVDRRHRLVADENIRHAFGDQYTPAQRDRLVRAVYRHFCRLLIELIYLPQRVKAGTLAELFEFERSGEYLDAILCERPAMMVTGHLGNWEAAGFYLGLIGCRMYPIARPLDNPYLDTWLRELRQRTGQTILAKNDDYARIKEVLASGGILATLADQDAGPRALFVDFFGRPASTHKAIAILSLEYDVPLLVSAMVIAPETGKFRVLIADRIDPREYAGRPDAVAAITQRFTAGLERMVREYPEQYFWLHRRWKHQPKVRARKAA
jgi:KDO2-lipid IV(A) lauroyltransferase